MKSIARSMKKSKGQDSSGKMMVAFVIVVVLGLGLAAIVASIVGAVLSSVQTTQLDTGTAAAAENFTINNASAATLSNARCVASSINITNSTNGVEFQPANYSASCTTASSTITWLTGTGNNTVANISYNYNFDQFPIEYNITGSGMLGLGNLASQFGLIGTVAGLVAVLITLFLVLGRRGKTGFV